VVAAVEKKKFSTPEAKPASSPQKEATQPTGSLDKKEQDLKNLKKKEA